MTLDSAVEAITTLDVAHLKPPERCVDLRDECLLPHHCDKALQTLRHGESLEIFLAEIARPAQGLAVERPVLCRIKETHYTPFFIVVARPRVLRPGWQADKDRTVNDTFTKAESVGNRQTVSFSGCARSKFRENVLRAPLRSTKAPGNRVTRCGSLRLSGKTNISMTVGRESMASLSYRGKS